MAIAGVTMARVLIGRFNPVMRLGLQELLQEAGCELIGEGGSDGHDLAEHDLIDLLGRTLPDVLLVDLADEGLARSISVAFPSIKVIACAASGPSMRIFPRFHHGESFLAPLSAESLADASSVA